MDCSNRKRKIKGFTLVELIIVIAIIAILATLAVPNLLDSVEKAKQTKDEEHARLIGETIIRLKAQGSLDDSYSGVTGYTLAATTTATGLRGLIQSEFNGKIPKPKSKKYKGRGVASNYIIDFPSGKIIVYCLNESGVRYNLYEYGN